MALKNVTLRQLRVFEAVARLLSYSRAAEELHLTQPAVSMQVQALEELAGLPLTEQFGKRIALTPAGTELAQLARRLGAEVRATEENLAAVRGVEAGSLHIGVVSTAKYFAPALLAEFRRRHPGITLSLSVNNRSLVVKQLANNEIDLALMGSPPKDFATVAERFAEHPLIFIAAPDHPLVKRRRVPPEALASETLLIREPGSGTRGALERFLEEHQVKPQATIELGSNETIKQAVMAGLGIAFLSEHTIGLERQVGRILRLAVAGTPVKRGWHLVFRADKRMMPAAIAFQAFVKAEGARLLKAQVGG
ncbi:HTH-type transcriptional activator CmpR [Burkholderiales bacterium]|nr:MAG: LysR family transcriptional regulator [Burkholderiales bacterium]CAG0988491.1 HTH-type transcriptional activator CmpR [Burkholderiales bacterium]